MSKTPFSLILVRHGVTDWNEEGRLLGRNDIQLNARGRAEAKRAAEALRRIPLQAVWSSPQHRTMETAQVIASSQGLPVETHPGLDEVWLGSWQGKLIQELRGDPDLEKYIEDPITRCDAIEPASEVQDRIVAFAERCRSTAKNGTFVLVSHGDPLRLLVVHYLAMELGSYRRLALDTGSISVLRFSPRGARLLALNWKSGSEALARFFSDI